MNPDSKIANRLKPVIYVRIPGYQGICHVLDWSEEKQRYVKRTKGSRYYAYKKIKGIQKSKTFDSFEQAREWRQSPNIFEQTEEPELLIFEQLLTKFFEHMESEIRFTTLDTYKSKAQHFKFFHSLPVTQINSLAIDAWLKHIKRPSYLELQHKSRLTYRHELSLLKQVLTYYREYLNADYELPFMKRHSKDAIVDKMRLDKKRASDKYKFIPREDYERFLSVLSENASRKPETQVLSVLAEFQVRTGTRIGEASALYWKDIDLETGEAMVSKTVQWGRRKDRPTTIGELTKTGEPRLLPLPSQVVALLRQWKHVSGRSVGLVFSLDGFSPLPYRKIQYFYDRGFRDAGLHWTGSHVLRHSYATDFLVHTQDKLALQKLLGHRTDVQTQRYAKVTEQMAFNGVKAYEASLQQGNVTKLHHENGTPDTDRLVVAGKNPSAK